MADPHTQIVLPRNLQTRIYLPLHRVCKYIYILYVYRENVIGRPNAFADLNALSVYTVEHERY